MTVMDGNPEVWVTRTHVWATGVDHEHLNEVRSTTGPIDSLHSALEVLAYADEEAAALERTGSVSVTIAESSIAVDDDGRGTETRVTPDGAVIRKPVMSTKDVRFYGRDDAPLLPDGGAREGISSVAAVCESLVHENHRDGSAWTQTYRQGVPDDDLETTRFRGHSGTIVTFSAPDATAVDLEKLRGLARSFGHLSVTFIDTRSLEG